MKKLISGISALALAVAIAPMSAFAENETGGTTNVSFNAVIEPAYTITIPASVNLNAETPTATIKAENVYLDTTKHKQINVTLDSAQYVSKGDSTFIAKTEDGSSSVTYTIGKGTATTGVKVGDVVAEFTNNPDEAANPDVQTATLSFSEPTGATYAGTHTETLTFGIAVVTTRTVTWNNDDITGSGNSFSKDGVTITAGSIDFDEKNFEENGTFTTTLGNFTKIEVVATNGFCDVSGTGWSGNSDKRTWTGNASSVSFIGDIYGDGNGIKFVFTIEP